MVFTPSSGRLFCNFCCFILRRVFGIYLFAEHFSIQKSMPSIEIEFRFHVSVASGLAIRSTKAVKKDCYQLCASKTNSTILEKKFDKII